MEYFAVIDCGTTNSRVYLLNKNKQMIAKGNRKVGVRDTALTGSRETLKVGLKELVEETVFSAGLSIKDISFAITSGMITSEIGLLEIPHLWAPVSIDDLASNMKIVQDPKIFPLDIPLYFIRGIKNYFPENTTYKDIRKIDFMRGEETQVAGLLNTYPDIELPVIIIILSSHTKYIYINKDKQICGSLTTLSGQIYEAIKKETSIGKSIQEIDENNEGKNNDYFNEAIINIAYNSVINSGFLRTLMMPRFMEVLLKTTWYERGLFVNASISTEDLKVIEDFPMMGFSLENPYFFLVGNQKRCKLLEYLLNRYINTKKRINLFYDKDKIDQLSIDGAIEISKRSGYLI
jgi:2-dehydro-3-deoxygalactonokinase